MGSIILDRIPEYGKVTIKENTWYKIPKFNGYEFKYVKINKDDPDPEGFSFIDRKINVAHAVRSWKNFNEYPNGYLLPYTHHIKNYLTHRDQTKMWYEMTDFNNNRKRLTYSAIYDLLQQEPYYAIEVEENHPNIGSRNKAVSTEKPSKNKKKEDIKNKTMSSLMANLIDNNNSEDK